MGTGLAIGKGKLRAQHRAGSTSVARPFLKWAGGKAQLIDEIVKRLPLDDEPVRYVEPFLGGGAVFFWMRQNLPYVPCRIADRNAALVETYRVVRDSLDALIAALRAHAQRHSPEHYYAVRRNQPADDVERAARFIYLNRTCYNGLWRVNRDGRFNVPLGRYDNPRILDELNLRRVSGALQGVEILCKDFEDAVYGCGPGDWIYFDPPYQPLSPTSRFTAYTPGGFDLDSQRRLARVFELLNREGAFVILSNSDVEPVPRLYEKLVPRPVLDRVRVARSINSKGDRRGVINELLIYSASGNRARP
ncbi:MAG: DNA adenine methylase [Vicinamibacteria bacterium]